MTQKMQTGAYETIKNTYFCGKIKLKDIKKTLKISGFVAAGIIFLFATAFILLQNSNIQNKISQTVVKTLSDMLNTQIGIESIYYKIPNVISIKKLYVEDQKQDSLLFVEQVDLHFSLLRLLKGDIVIKSVVLDSFSGKMVVDSTGTNNIDFIIKALNKEPSGEQQLSLDIRRLTLKNSSFSFTDHRIKTSSQAVFNSRHFNFKDINTDLSFRIFNKDSIALNLKSFSAEDEFSGLAVTNIKAKASYSSSSIQLPKLHIEMPNSSIDFNPIVVAYDSISDFQHFSEKVKVSIPIRESSIALSDLAAFVPELSSIKGKARMQAELGGRISNLKLKNLQVAYGQDFLLEGGLELTGLPDVDETFVFGNIDRLRVGKKDIQDFLSDLNQKPIILPKELSRLGIMEYSGKATGFFSDLVIYGKLSTLIGDISTDLKLQFSNKLNDVAYNGTIQSRQLQLGQLTGQKDLGKFAFNINTQGAKKANSSLQGKIKAKVSEFQFRDYIYEDIIFDGAYDGNGFDGSILFEDENLKASFDGVIDLRQELPLLDFGLTVDHVNPHALKLIDTYPEANLSFKISTNMEGNSLDNANGFMRLEDLVLTNKGQSLNIADILIDSEITDQQTKLSIKSDFLKGSLRGQFRYSTIAQTVKSILSKYLPAISSETFSDRRAPHEKNSININLKLENTNSIFEVLELPYSLEGKSNISGKIDETNSHVDLAVNVPALLIGTQDFKNLSIRLSNINRNAIELTCRSQYKLKDALTNFFINASAGNDVLNTRLGWQNTKAITYAGDINVQTKFTRSGDNFSAHARINPTDIILADSTWNIHPGSIHWRSNKSIEIENFRIDKQNQFIHIQGRASEQEEDRLHISMNRLNVGFIMDLLQLTGLKIGGIATGNITLSKLFQRAIYEADIHVDDVMLNGIWIGNADLFSTWNQEKQQIEASGTFLGQNKEKVVEASGIYEPAKDSLDFLFDAKDLNIGFLAEYFKEVAPHVQGSATGKIRMYGPSKSFGFEGDAFVRDAEISIGMLKTTYHFSDYIYLKRNLLEIKNLHIYDSEKNLAIANGKMKHNGLFSDMDFDFLIKTKNLMAINTQSHDNEYFFGKAYVGGSVRLFGNMKEVNIVADAVSRAGTKVYIRMASMSTASDNNFIKFIDKNANPYAQKKKRKKENSKSDVNVKINLQVETTPEAEVELIIDPKAGDMISAKGRGSLRVEFDSYSDMKLFGTYTIESGYYLFSLQNLIRKNFRIEQGSSISWSGDVKNASVNIRAIYSLTASLLDLMGKDQVKMTTSRSNVPVNCILILSENLMNPNISFNINLPSSDEGVKQYVKSIINTEEMMNRQILFLLLLGRFYTPDYLITEDESNKSNNEGLAFFTATLNGWMSRMIQSNKLSFGFDLRTDEQSAEIHYQPNNRLIVNGNIGYQRNELSDRRNRVVGDLDMEYLLTQSGKLRFKGYSHTVDRLGSAKISYGAGFLYKEEFKDLKSLFNYYWRLFNSIWKKKEEEESEVQPDKKN